MASFCGSCGFALGANGTFCPRCGGRQAGAPQPPLPPAAKGGGLKVLAIVLACLGVAGVALVGGLWYLGHRVKEAVVAKAQENGVDASSIVPPHTRSPLIRRHHKACDLLSKEEASSLLGEPIERTAYQDAACLYFGPPGLSAKLAQEQMSSTFKRAQGPDPQVGGAEVANAVDQMVNALAAGGQTGGDGEMPLLMLVVDDDGAREQMIAMNASGALFGGFFNAAAKDHKTPLMITQIKGLGDQAVRLPKLGLNVLSGDTFFRLIPGAVPDADAKTIEVARAVLKKL